MTIVRTVENGQVRLVFTRKNREELRKAYKAASAASSPEFEFDGEWFVTGYAKYLLEYLDGLDKGGPND